MNKKYYQSDVVEQVLSTKSYKTNSFGIDLINIPICTVAVQKMHIKEWKTVKNDILSLINFSENEDYFHDPLISFTDYLREERDIPYVKEMVSLLTPYLQQYREHALFKFKGISTMWCQRYNENDFHIPHDHGTKGYSAVFYAEFDPEVHQSTSFLTPFPNEVGVRPFKQINVIEGDLIIFPSNLVHMSIPHKSDRHRTIISFNLH